MLHIRQKKKEEEKEKDELHIEYGILRNILYILKSILRYKKSVLFFVLAGSFSGAVLTFLWGFLGKFIIDYVEEHAASPDSTIFPLLKLLLTALGIQLFCSLLNELSTNRVWWNFIYVRMCLIEERIKKTMLMNYEALEDPKMLDRMGKAAEATGGNSNGVEGMMHSVQALLKQFFTLLLSVFILSFFQPLIIFAILLFSFLQYLFFSHTVKKDKVETWDKMAPHWRKINYMEQTTQDFSYAKDIRLFRMKGWLSQKHQEVNRFRYEHLKRSKWFWIYNSWFSHGISLLRNAVLYGYLVYSVLFRNLSIGDFTLYLSSMLAFSTALTEVFNSLSQNKQRSMEVDDFRSFLAIPDPDAGRPAKPLPKPPYEFVFDHVSFRYAGQPNDAVKDLSLKLQPGARLAVVGLNGAGKSTFIKLLLRLYDVTEGRILLNGTDIREFRRSDYYTLFSPVFQDIRIFAFPLAENVSMQTPEQTDAVKAENSLKLSGLEEKLSTLPAGIQTELLKNISSEGIDLSGGEKQKLALARALYKDAGIILLDEPTAALDALAEYRLYQNFDKLIGGKSAVYISHRLSSTRFCDQVAMFENGRMAEYGTHEELLAAGGAYAHLFQVQAQYYQENQDTNGEELTADA